MNAKTIAAGLALALLAPQAPAWAQADAPPPDPQAEATIARPDRAAIESRDVSAPLAFDRIGLADGLPQSSAEAIVQDTLGYIWIGTEDGLARYDGHNMRVYRTEVDDPTTILGNWITSLAVGPDGRMWVGTHDGASIYDPSTDEFTRLVHDPEDPASARPGGVNEIHVDETGAWLARMQGGLDHVDADTLEVARFTEAPIDHTITTMSEDASGLLWLGTTAGMLVFDPVEGAGEEYTTEDEELATLDWATITSSYVDAHGLLWIGSENDGLFIVDPEERTTLRHMTHIADDPESLSDNEVTSFLEDDRQRMWIGTRGGLSRLDSGSDTFVRYDQDARNPRSLPYSHIQTIFQDRGGVIWIGTRGQGLAVFDELRLSFAHHRTKVATTAFYEDPDGTIWAGGDRGQGLYRFDPNGHTETIYSVLGEPGSPGAIDLTRTHLLAIDRTSPDVLWIGTYDQGLIRFNTETGAFRQFSTQGLTNHHIWGMWEAPDGMLWLATWGGGLVIFDRERETFSGYQMVDLPGLGSDHLYALYPDPVDEDLVWLGTAEGGLCRLDRATVSVNCFTRDGDDPTSISSNNVTGIYRAPDGPLWVTTHGEGLNRIDPDTGEATHFTMDNSALEANTLYAILADDDEGLWVSSTNGLYHVDPETEEFTRYGAGDGLQSAEFALGSAHKGRDGRLFFGGVDGFNVFDPQDIAPDDYVPPVVITDFRSFDEELPLDSPVWNLPTIDVSHTSSFEFEFAALSFAAPDANRYAYKLEGFDSEWIEGRRFASYGRLSGGTYTLKVRAANRHGVWNEEGVELDIRVAPAPWRTWWAYSLYGLTFLGALGAYRRYNQQKLTRLEQTTRLEAVERDLELTGAVQHGFLPQVDTVDEGRIRIHGFYRAAEACGGDWWWHEQPAEGHHQILVGDVTGHGPGPAMVTAAVATAFRVQSGLVKSPIPDKLDILNQEVLLAGQGKYHMVMAALELNEHDGTFSFYSAGSTPLLRHKKNDRARALPCRGTPLGTSGFELGHVTGQLEPGERLLLYTDGIPEIPISPDRLLGMRRFSKMFEQTGELGLEEALATIVSSADRLRGQTPQDDDWTMVVIEWG